MAFIGLGISMGGSDFSKDKSFKNAGVTPSEVDCDYLAAKAEYDQCYPDHEKGWPKGNGYLMMNGQDPNHTLFS